VSFIARWYHVQTPKPPVHSTRASFACAHLLPHSFLNHTPSIRQL
jgi:hypothetical protein